LGDGFIAEKRLGGFLGARTGGAVAAGAILLIDGFARKFTGGPSSQCIGSTNPQRHRSAKARQARMKTAK